MNDFKKSLEVEDKKGKNKSKKDNKNYYIMYNDYGDEIGTIYAKYVNQGMLQNQRLKVISMFVITQNGKLLLEKRAETDLTPNKIDLVSGHIDKKEKGKETARREAREEASIKPKKIVKLKKVKNDVPLTIESREFFVKFYFAIVNMNINQMKLQQDEVKSLMEVPLEEGFELIRQEKTRFPYKGNEEIFEEIFEKVRKFYDRYFNKEECKEMDEK